ncbi:DNA-directed RNA polymerase subunit F [Variovorax boronicumulans]|uniref:hypothetical protein n=1 Tax=Variovorax boronicumulans TaxID=436515 RepID=UPI00339B6BB0
MTTNSLDWNEPQLNPDNWIVIPEFGVAPGAVDFEGFAFPILDPSTDQGHWRRALFDASTMVRQEARNRFGTLKEIKDLHPQAYEDDCVWTTETVFSVRYWLFFQYLKQSIEDFEDDKEGCLNSVSIAMQMALKMVEDRAVDLAEVRGELSRIANMRAGSSKGGKQSGKTRRARAKVPSQTKLRELRGELIAAGTSKRNVAGKLATRFGCTADHIRKVLDLEKHD